jgi:hypothetical protein
LPQPRDEKLKSKSNYKLKTALTLSVLVNAVFVLAVGYMLATDIDVDDIPPIVIFTNAPTAMVEMTTVAMP